MPLRLPPAAEAEEHVILLEREESQEFVSRIGNLDAFIQQLYAYFYARGYACLLVEGVLRGLRTAFVIAFTAFLLFRVDWPAALACHHEACETTRLLRPQPFRDLQRLHKVGLALEAAFGLHLLVLLLRFTQTLRTVGLVREVYRQLAVDESRLPTLPWGEVVDRLYHLQSRMLLSRVGRVDHLHLMMRLMRVDNFMVALLNLEVLDFTLFGWPVPLTRSLEWNLRYLLNFLLTQHPTYHPPDVSTDTPGFASKVRWLGAMNLVAAPFVACYLLIVALFAHGAELKLSPKKISTRRWSRSARWLLRDYNEAPHLFEARMQHASPLAQAYIDQFPYRLLPLFARLAVFVAGGFASAILLLSFLHYPLLLYAEVQGQNLLWWLSVLTLVVVTGLQLSEEPLPGHYDPVAAWQELSAHLPPAPSRVMDPRDVAVRDEIAALYTHRAVHLLQGALSVLVTPLFLIFSLSRQTDRFLRFMRDFTAVVDSVGPVCVFSTFDVERRVRVTPAQRDKLAASLRAFQTAYPNWTPTGRRQTLGAEEEMVIRDPPADV